jgi:hypothetical protein
MVHLLLGALRFGQEAGSSLAPTQLVKRRLLLEAAVECVGAAGVEAASLGRIGKVGDVTTDRRPAALSLEGGVGDGDDRQQGLRVGVTRF